MNNIFNTFMLSAALVLATSCTPTAEIVEREQKAKADQKLQAAADSTKAAQAAAKLKAKTP